MAHWQVKTALRQKCKYMLLWSGDHGLDLFNTQAPTNKQQKDLKEYRTRFKDHVKPQANKKS